MTCCYSLYVFLLILFGYFSLLQANQICNTPYGSYHCYADTYGTIAYCCSKLGCHPQEDVMECLTCCYYTQVWVLWYFWLGIIIGFCLLVSGISLCISFYKNKQRNRSSSQNPNVSVTGTDGAVRMSDIENCLSNFEDLPPSYDQLQTNKPINSIATTNPDGFTEPASATPSTSHDNQQLVLLPGQALDNRPLSASVVSDGVTNPSFI